MVSLEAQTFTKEIEKAMNNALDIHKSEGMNVAHLQGGNLEDGVLGNTGGSEVETIFCFGTWDLSESSFGNPKFLTSALTMTMFGTKKNQDWGHPGFGHARTETATV